jgi:hypothetical protein
LSIQGDIKQTNTYLAHVYLMAAPKINSQDGSVVIWSDKVGAGKYGNNTTITFPGRGLPLPAGWYVYPRVLMGGLCGTGALRVDAILYTDFGAATYPVPVK